MHSQDHSGIKANKLSELLSLREKWARLKNEISLDTEGVCAYTLIIHTQKGETLKLYSGKEQYNKYINVD